MGKYAALGFGFTAKGETRKALQKAVNDTGIDADRLRYIEKNGVKKIVDVKTGKTVRRLK
jgi:hypothetical protein